jgi:hypothetical protein
MTKTFVTLFLALLVTYAAYGQYGTGNPEKMKQLQNRKLIVVLEEESAQIIKILQTKRRPDQIEKYRKSVADYNAAMKEVVEKLWQFDTKILYMKFTDAKRLYKTDQYAVLYCATVENFKHVGQTGGKMHEGLVWSYQNLNAGRDYWDKYTVMQIKLVEELSKSTPVFSQNLANIFPEKSDMVFGLQTLNLYIREAGKRSKSCDLKQVMQVNGQVLSSKTLLLRKDWAYHSLTDKAIKEVYPHPFLLTDAGTFNNLVMQGDSSYAYLQIVPEITSLKNKIKINYLHLIIDAAEGKVLGVSSPGLSEGSKIITKANLKDYSDYARQ